MANVGTSAVKIIDNDNDVVSVTNNKLDVNATLAAGAAIDIGDVEITGHSTIANGSNTDIDTSAEVLGARAACKEVVIQAATTNTGIVYVGASGVSTTTGIALNAGDAFSFNIDNIDNVYVIASAINQAVSYVYFN
jgi:hypothetical protein